MSNHTPKVSLVSMPPEILRLIFPESLRAHKLHLNGESSASLPLPRRQERKRVTWEWQQVLDLFRTLSHTCRSLRFFVLPFMWETVQLNTVNELGKLFEVLRLEPHIGTYIRHFKFNWTLGDALNCELYDASHGTLLEMAFLDRGELWERTRKELDGKLKFDAVDGWYFDYNQVRFLKPGTSESRFGPDDQGEDARIKSVKDFNDAFTEIVSRLTSVQTFCWQTTVTPMPAGVFEALKKAQHLTALQFNLAVRRGHHCFVPFWELVSKVTDLSISDVNCNALHRSSNRKPRREAQITSFELPGVPLEADNEVAPESAELVLGIACRTLITAARGPGLVRVALRKSSIETIESVCFTIPSLLPCWLAIEDWNWPFHFALDRNAKSYVVSVALLRAALAHTSHALRLQRNEPDQQHLTAHEVQAMHTYFKKAGQPVLVSPKWRQDNERPKLAWGAKVRPGTPFERYLFWLRDDAELAGDVAAAWNAVVNSGNADTFRCYCGKCYDARELHRDQEE